MAKAGRPRKEIDMNQFEKLCAIQCTLAEIASWFNCSEDTIERWCKREYKVGFAEIYKKKSETGKISLRRIQFKQAEHSVPMAIWLGKQYLGQREPSTTVAVEDDTLARAQDILAGLETVIK